MTDLLFWVLLAAVAGTFLTFAVVWTLNYRQTDSAERATQRTSRKFVAVASAGVFSLVIAINEMAGLVGTVGDIVAAWPAAFGQFILGILAIAGFAGWVELGVVGVTLIVALVIIISVSIRN